MTAPESACPPGPDGKPRCPWALGNPLLLAYHDDEWGRPVRDDRTLFEFLLLEGFQAGLSWLTILKRREGFRRAFAAFDPETVAAFDAPRLAALRLDEGIIRNRLKIEASQTNARAFLAVAAAQGSFADYLWGFVDGRPVVNAWKSMAEIPAATPLSDRLSRDLKARGFRFVGTTICYAFLQAVGLVDDHLAGCFCRQGRSG